MRYLDADYPADPYPGGRPPSSYVHLERVGYALSHTPSGFVVAAAALDLDRWLEAKGAAPLEDRIPVLAYGSNACPAKLTWLRENLGLTGPVVVLCARCTGFAAVWAAGSRARDGQRPVTLTAMADVVEEHAVVLATEDQLRVFDACEGADIEDPRYRREVLSEGSVTVDGWAVDGRALPNVQAYLGVRADRLPLLADGAPICAFAPAHPPTPG